MTVVVRSRRRPAPALPSGDLTVPAPPVVPVASGSRWTHLLIAVPMLAGTLATAMMFAGRQGGTYSYVIGGVFGISSLGMLATSFGTGPGRRRHTDLAAARRDYLRQLTALRERVRANARAQHVGLGYRHPAANDLWSLVDGHRIWERRVGDADFGVVRVGLGPQALATPLIPPTTAVTDDLEPISAAALRRFLDTCALVRDLPIAVTVTGFARVHVPDPDDAGRALIRALIASLTVFHGPDDLLVAACVEPRRRMDWDYLKWLPHARHPDRFDAIGGLRLVSGRLDELELLLGSLLSGRARFAPGRPATSPQIVVILDGGDPSGGRHLVGDGVAGVCVLEIGGTKPDAPALTLSVTDDGMLRTDTGAGPVEAGRAEGLTLAEADALARRLAPLRPETSTRPSETATSHDGGLAALLGLDDPAGFDVRTQWTDRPERQRLRVPIGTDASGTPVELDLKESAQDGMGPHGLLIGATGSGKSELLRTLVLALAATHDSASLNFVLVDFKGGATFASLDRLPHTAAVITNLADELSLVDRMADALNGELTRRQEVLRKAGNLASLRDYERARAGGAILDPLPVLLIVCDEFSELLTAKPEFVDLFVAIGRLGRSLGMHLLLASQRLDEGRLRGLDTHLSYRIGLRTFSAMESRSVLGVPDAYELPRSPGHGYLKFGTEPLVRFQAAYVSGPTARATESPVAAPSITVLPFTMSPVGVPAATSEPPPATGGPSLLELVVSRLRGAGVPAHQVWLPPLSTPVPLGTLLGPLDIDPERGFTTVDRSRHGGLRVPVGFIDKPLHQRRDPLWLSLDAAAGHVAIVGGPQSGKSTLVRTLIGALALTHTPCEVTCYCLDFGGGALGSLRDLPHVGAVVGRLATEAVRRTVGEVATILADRERHFTETGVASIAEARDSARRPLDPYGDLFLVIDGWSTVRSEYEDLESVITDIATRGLSYGVHVVLTASRWADFRTAIRDLLGSRLELRLGDVAESRVSRKAASDVPERSPGRGITTDGMHFLTASPLDSPDGVERVATAWTGPVAPAVRELPALVPHVDLGIASGDDLAIPIGIAESDLRPVFLDFAADPHVLVFGDSGSGKSAFLRTLAASITHRYRPDQARIVVVDYRRSMLGEIEGDHLIGYATAAEHATELIASVASYMDGRRPGLDVTPSQLRTRSWWTGPECFVLVDDFDLIATGPSSPLTPLLEHLSQARDVGLHLVVARRTGGAARALYEPVLARLRELAGPGLLLSGDRDEGALLNSVRPRPLPPGRATLVRRQDGNRLVQLAYALPRDDS